MHLAHDAHSSSAYALCHVFFCAYVLVRVSFIGTQVGKLVHKCSTQYLGSSCLIAHVLHCPPPFPAHSLIGPAVISTHTHTQFSNLSTGVALDDMSAAATSDLALRLACARVTHAYTRKHTHTHTHTQQVQQQVPGAWGLPKFITG